MNQTDIDELRNRISYNPDTGHLTWLKPRSNRVKPGATAGRINDQGYVTVCVASRFYRGHRLAFALHFGLWPGGLIDHINGDRSDNRISNLRECSNAENLHNTGKKSSNKSGFKGAYFDKASRRWCASIKAFGKKIYLGRFDSKEEAAEAYAKASKVHHGKFSKT
jgi:hypothetical protein